jgi:hypothetical protein
MLENHLDLFMVMPTGHEVYSVYDPTNGHQLHGHCGGGFYHPCQWT